METRDLRWFQQVADGMTLTELSDLEQVSQSGISRALGRLDAEVGAPLLGRSGRTLRLTRAGAAFKRHVDLAVHELDDGLAAVQRLLDPEAGAVRLAFQPSLGTWLVPELVSRFRRAHPRVQVGLTSKQDERVSAVGAGADVELEFTTRPPSGPTVRWKVLAREPLMLGIGPEHPWSDRQHVELAEAAELPFVATHPRSHLWEATLRLCHQAGFEPRVALVCEDLPTTRAFVSAGIGVAVLPVPDAWIPTHEGLRLVTLEDLTAYRDVGIAWSTEQDLLPSARLFLEHVVAQMDGGDVVDGWRRRDPNQTARGPVDLTARGPVE